MGLVLGQHHRTRGQLPELLVEVGQGLVAGLLIVRVAESALTRVLFEVKATDVGVYPA